MISIISATEKEIKGFIAKIDDPSKKRKGKILIIEGRYNDQNISVAISGVGTKRAREATRIILQRKDTKLVISAGFSGALNPELEVGDIVIGKWVYSLERQSVLPLSKTASNLGFPHIEGGFLTTTRFINRPEEKKKLKTLTDALCVDMETWGVAEALRDTNIPLIGIRSISDTLNHTLPKMERIFSKEEKLDYTKTAKYFFSNPKLLFPFIKFRYIDVIKASKSLEQSLCKLIVYVT